MELDELYPIVLDWYRYNRISPINRERVKQEAIRLELAKIEGCRPCFWEDVYTNTIMYLRQKGYSFMKTEGKYILRNGEPAMIPMTAMQFVAQGEGSETLKLIGDPANEELVESVLERYPEMKEVILENPKYKTAEVATTAPAAKGKKGKTPASVTDELATGETPADETSEQEATEGSAPAADAESKAE